MNLIPFENTEIKTSKNRKELLGLLESKIEPNDTLGFTIKKASNKEYEGIININLSEFKIRRILKTGRNSFIPMVYGKINDSGNGCTLKLKIRLQKIVAGLLIIMCIFGLGMVLFSLNSISESKEIIEIIYQDSELKEDLKNNKQLNQIHNSRGFDWTALILLFFLYGMTTFFFNREAEKVKDDFKKVLE